MQCPIELVIVYDSMGQLSHMHQPGRFAVDYLIAYFAWALQTSSSSSSWRRRKQTLRGLCIREIDVESQILVTNYYSKLRFPMPWRSAL